MKYSQTTIDLIRRVSKIWAPPPELTVSEWAEAERYLSPEANPEPGKWRNDRAPHAVEIMDTISDPDIEMTVAMLPSQSAKTEIILNTIGYFIHQDPSPIMLVQPNVKPMGEAFAKDRLAPMIRDTPALRGLVADPRSRDSGNTILHKTFPGGQISIAGANSAASLASRPIRVLLGDELDRWPVSAGPEGDPWSLSKKRTNRFENRVIVAVSSPTDEGNSKIAELHGLSDKRIFQVPCPRCGDYQVLKWSNLKFEREDGETLIPESIHYICELCEGVIDQEERFEMFEEGEWQATNKGVGGVAGFHMSELSSGLSSWERCVRQFLESKDNPETHKTWVNTCLAELWKVEKEKLDHNALFNRRENYSAQVPADGLVLVSFTDVQGDRLETEVRAFGKNSESWGVEYRVIYGNPIKQPVWDQLGMFLRQTWTHESGTELSIAASGIDSGYLPTMVYEFCRKNRGRRVWATKGDKAVIGAPMFKVMPRGKGKNKRPVELMMIGTDTAKSTLFTLLEISEHGPGYCHFPLSDDYNQEYFEQLAGEEIRYRTNHGRKERYWYQTRPRNEALDLFVGNLAVIHRLNPVWEQFEKMLQCGEQKPKKEPGPKSNVGGRGRGRQRGGFVNNY
ncbi:MAG: phage terminase large subunit family protein [bacterium]|nr:phage terminase large subunit family protein [bacterium]